MIVFGAGAGELFLLLILAEDQAPCLVARSSAVKAVHYG